MYEAPPRLVPLSVMARRLRVRAAWLLAEAEAGRVPHVPAEPAPLFSPEAVEKILVERASEMSEPSGSLPGHTLGHA